MTTNEAKYKWHAKDGIMQGNQQRLQLIGGTRAFRDACGKLLVEKLNSLKTIKEL